MKKYGLIGKHLKHSFSPGHFGEKFNRECIDATYETFELNEIGDFISLLEKRFISGLNVTIPYKQQVIPFLDEMDSVAKEIGAVNTIKFTPSGTKGYNTDVLGFERSLLEFIGDQKPKALILGTGGASAAVKYVFKKLGISYQVVSRKAEEQLWSYEDLRKKDLGEFPLIVNVTPLGMYPDLDRKPDIPYDQLTDNHYLFDLIYNPEKTTFLKLGEQMGAHIQNGLDMLIYQAEESWKIWNS